MRPFLFCLLLIASATSLASEIYRYTDERGNPVFTNEPPSHVNAKPVNLPPPTIVELRTPEIPAGISASDEVASQSADGKPYRVVAITGLPQDRTIRANDGRIELNVQLVPALRPGHSLRFLLDGEPVMPSTTSASLQLDNVPRGKHNLQVEVLAGDKVIQRSAVETFHVQRVALGNAPNRPAKP